MIDEQTETIETIDFVNLESNQEIKLKLDKKMIFIYGKNGSGKTTFSRSKNLDRRYVFNEDFIHRNVYIIDEEGAKVDTAIKNNFSQLLIGEDVVNLKKQQDKMVNLQKSITEEYKQLNTNIAELFNKANININYNSLANIKDENLIVNFNQSISDQLNSYRSNFSIETNIKSEDELNKSLNQIQKQENIASLISKIKNIPMLYEYLYAKDFLILNRLNESILYIKTNIETIKKIENLAAEKNIKKTDFNIISSWIDLQVSTNKNDCIFCGSPNIKEKITEWQSIINDKIVKFKNDLTENLNSISSETQKILDNKELYEPIAPITIKNIINFNNTITSAIENINNEKFDFIKYEDRLEEKLTENIEDIIKNVANFLVYDYKDKIIFFNSILDKINKIIVKIKLAIEEKLKLNAEKHTKSISEILIALGLDKEIKVAVDKYGGNIKYSLNITNNKLSTLSDGQKHKLSLAVFLNSIKELPLENKILVFDDPMVSLDELGYHLFKSYLIKNVLTLKENNPTLIILTHNFNYLYIQISNIITNKELKNITKVLKLNQSGFETIDIELFKLDDIALFKKCLNEMRFKEELILLSRLYNKIFREFLDLKLRINGNPICENPGVEIDKLQIENDSKIELHKFSDEFCSHERKKHPSFDNSKIGLKSLKQAITLLGFNDYITNNDIEKVETLLDKNENNSSSIFTIIEIIVEILNTEEIKYNEFINYLNHPRVSYTKNIIASSLDI